MRGLIELMVVMAFALVWAVIELFAMRYDRRGSQSDAKSGDTAVNCAPPDEAGAQSESAAAIAPTPSGSDAATDSRGST